jgi:hypothetical protein
MACKIKPKPHAMDRIIERGISLIEFRELLAKGKRTKRIKMSKNTTKDFFEHRIYKAVCICSPCNIRVESVMLR